MTLLLGVLHRRRASRAVPLIIQARRCCFEGIDAAMLQYIVTQCEDRVQHVQRNRVVLHPVVPDSNRLHASAATLVRGRHMTPTHHFDSHLALASHYSGDTYHEPKHVHDPTIPAPSMVFMCGPTCVF